MNSTRIRILVVEDDEAILRGLLDLLVFKGYAPEGVADGEEALDKARGERYDLLLLDVMLPGRDGFSICREIRKSRPDQAVIMLTAKGAEEDIVNGFQAGADDYVSKPFSIQELLVRIEAVLRRSARPVGSESTRIMDIVFDGATLTASRGRSAVELTRREMDIIFYLYRHHPRIISRKELLARVWDYAVPDLETRTVDIHILKLRKKLSSLADNRSLIVTVRGEGYRLEGLA